MTIETSSPTNLAQGTILGGQMNPEWKAEQAARDAKFEVQRKADMVLNKRGVAVT